MVNDVLNNKRNSKEVFIIINDREISFKEFNHLIDQFNAFLVKTSYRINRLAIDLSAKLNILIAIIGCNRLGITPIIVPHDYRKVQNINYSKLANADHELRDNNCIIQLNDDCKDSKNIIDKEIQCILFTSGSEGIPKPVELTYNNIYNSASNWNGLLNFRDNNNYLNILPIDHIGGLSIFFRSIYFDFISIVAEYNKNSILAQIRKYNIDYVSVVPKMISNMIECRELKSIGSYIKALIVGGDGINQYLYTNLKENNINTYISYGMTETSSGVCGYFINAIDKFEENFIGIPHANVKIFLKDSNIAIQSEVVMARYTNESDCNNIFIGSDIGELKNGKIYFISRGFGSIVSGGENVSLASIRNIINGSKQVVDCAVVGHKDKHWGMVPIVLFESNKKEIDIDYLSKYCKNNLPKHMVPKYYLKIDKIPYRQHEIDYTLIKYYIKKSLA